MLTPRSSVHFSAEGDKGAIRLAFNEYFLGRYPTIFARIEGRNGILMEYKALIAPSAEFCLIPKPDAYRLGYPEAASDDPVMPTFNTLTFASYTGYSQAALLALKRVDLGADVAFQNIDFLAIDIPQPCGFDVVLGRSLLFKTKIEMDYSQKKIKITKNAD